MDYHTVIDLLPLCQIFFVNIQAQILPIVDQGEEINNLIGNLE